MQNHSIWDFIGKKAGEINSLQPQDSVQEAFTSPSVHPRPVLRLDAHHQALERICKNFHCKPSFPTSKSIIKTELLRMKR